MKKSNYVIILLIIMTCLFQVREVCAHEKEGHDSFRDASLCGAYVNSGQVNTIENGYVVIDDAEYSIAPNVKVFSRHGGHIPLSSIARGNVIKFAVHNGKICALKKVGASTSLKNETPKQVTKKSFTRKVHGKYINY